MLCINYNNKIKQNNSLKIIKQSPCILHYTQLLKKTLSLIKNNKKEQQCKKNLNIAMSITQKNKTINSIELVKN